MLHPLQQLDLDQVLTLAKDCGACDKELKLIKQLESWGKIIAHHRAPIWVFWYANKVIKGRWGIAEDIILQSPEYCYYYCEAFCRINKWKAAEKVILTSPEYCYRYAKKIIQGRWGKAEEIILTSPEYCYWYAMDVIKGRWLEAEPVILKSSTFSYHYATNIIKDRWLEAEPIIMTNHQLALYYAQRILKHRWLEYEETLDLTDYDNWVAYYIKDFM